MRLLILKGLEELWTGLYPTLSTGGRCIALSTPNGVGNWFHKTCVDAETAVNNFNLTTLVWDVHPDRDETWYKKETKNMSKRQIAQELECNFNTSGETVIDSRLYGMAVGNRFVNQNIRQALTAIFGFGKSLIQLVIIYLSLMLPAATVPITLHSTL